MPKVYTERTGDVAQLVISAPPLNLFGGQLAADLEAALDEVAALTRDAAARAVLLRADGQVFYAGVDVHEFHLPGRRDAPVGRGEPGPAPGRPA